MSNQEEDEFIAVRVQDPRIQNEGSWNSYVDYKIFLHTNSKAFTAKTSCVRRRYSEFAWLKKKLQKNAGLVPVPDLPAKSFFSFSNEDFLEGRRKGLQAFLNKVVHMTVCLSDSQLHLFLQTQLPVGHIQDCVQGHTPFSVTDAILTYASSNRGFVQAQEEDSIMEPSLTVSYESMESPLPHQPCLPTKETLSSKIVPCSDSDPQSPEGSLCEKGPESSIRLVQKNNHLEAIVEDSGAREVSFILGDSQDGAEGLSPVEQSQQRGCRIQTPVEVHSITRTGFEVNCGRDGEVEEVSVESPAASEAEEESVGPADTEQQVDQQETSEEANRETTSGASSHLQDGDAATQEDVQENVSSEMQVLQNQLCDVKELKHVADVSGQEEVKESDGQNQPDGEDGGELEHKKTPPLKLDDQEENHNERVVPQVDGRVDDAQVDQKQTEQAVDLVGSKGESDEDGHSLPSSNESIVKVSDEESVYDEAEDAMREERGYVKTSPEDVSLWSEVDHSSRNILDLHLDGCSEEKEDNSIQEDALHAEALRYMTSINDLNDSAGDLTENSDFSILESSCSPGLADRKYTEQETL